MTDPERPPNQLIHEKSPYLLQHARNPVDWRPFGEEAIAAARERDVPLFLSIGYATCHWCHVMERESFEDEETARILNEFFVPVKVDREERPDLDAVYMTAVQLQTGHGGWPLSAWLTHDLRPFYTGTYFPRDAGFGQPAFRDVLRGIADAWRTRRDDIERSAGGIVEGIRRTAARGAPAERGLHAGPVQDACEELRASFDADHGGFGGAPKFPRSTTLELLLRRQVAKPDPEFRDMVETTLERMYRGGIHDHVAGGFARYATDEAWLVPHFEKMLYDNALLAGTYVEAWQATGNPLFERVATGTLQWVLAEMTSPEGGFLSALDADSEGEEGRFYVFTRDEIVGALGGDADFFMEAYGVTGEGNFEGRNILHLPRPEAEAAARAGLSPEIFLERARECLAKLRKVRATRIRPALDDKILTAWNGLMIGAMARAGAAFGNPAFLAAARRAADFVIGNLRTDGGLLRRWRDGEARFPGTLEDWAFLAAGLLDLFEAEFEPRDLAAAVGLADGMLARFSDPDGGALFQTEADSTHVAVRLRDLYDGATPSGNSVAAMSLVRLHQLTGEERFEIAARSLLLAVSGDLERAPGAYPAMLMALDRFLSERETIVIAGDRRRPETEAMLRALRTRFRPHSAVLLADGRNAAALAPLSAMVAGKFAGQDGPRAYICRGRTCGPPLASLSTEVG